MVASMQDLVTVVMNPDSEFQNLLARASSLPGLLQRLEEVNLRGKEVKFEDGYCVGYSESFNANSASAMTVTINISARKISVGDASLEKKW